jgi:putative membrane protein
MGLGNGMGMGWMWLFWLLLIIGVVLVVVVAARVLGGGVTRSDGGDGRASRERSRARQVLDERYARGEITTEEYHERLRVLGEDT